jgi:hypothetical protein
MVYLLSGSEKSAVYAVKFIVQPFVMFKSRGDIIGKVAENNLPESACVG